MINIVSPIKKLEIKISELEKEYNLGNISKKEYFAKKRDFGQEMETLMAAERVRRMQGNMGSEKTLDHWSDQEEEKKKLAEEAEKEEMLKKYITNPNSIEGRAIPSNDRFGKRVQMSFFALIFLALIVGTSMGLLFIKEPSTAPSVSMLVNETAFPPVANNTTTITSNTTSIVNEPPTTTDQPTPEAPKPKPTPPEPEPEPETPDPEPEP